MNPGHRRQGDFFHWNSLSLQRVVSRNSMSSKSISIWDTLSRFLQRNWKKTIEDTYLPMHAVYKPTSDTTKVRAVFDALAKLSTGVSLNDTPLVGPTTHPPLINVQLLFHLYPVTLTTDISKMYRAVELKQSDRDLHRFVWRSYSSADSEIGGIHLSTHSTQYRGFLCTHRLLKLFGYK